MTHSPVTASFTDTLPAEAAHIVETVCDIALLLNADGDIIGAHQTTEYDELDCSKWMGKSLEAFVTTESVEKVRALRSDALDDKPKRWRQLNHPMPSPRADSKASIAFEYQSLKVGEEDAVLLLGRDLKQLAALQERLIRAQQALEHDYDRFRQTESRYRQLFQLDTHGILVIDAANLSIVDANKASRAILAPLGGLNGTDLMGKLFPADFSGLLDVDSDNAIETLLREAVSGRLITRKSVSVPQSAEGLNVSFEGRDQAGNLILRLGASHSTEQALTAKTDPMLERVLEELPDALVVTDGNGVILKSNESFFKMTELASREAIQNSTVDRWLNFGGLSFSALTKTISASNGLRLIPAEMVGEFGTSREVEVSVTYLSRGAETRIGLLLRDISTRTTSQPKPLLSGDSTFDNISELIGQMALKDIVKETTDVIERMCLEAALSMTQGNRASAAEVLGLSRQSLYVKMRRFGIDRSQDN